MNILITGADGFVGKNLQLHLAERKDVAQLPALLQGVDFVFHLAGINRPQDPQEFVSGNVDLTQPLCQAVGAMAEATGKPVCPSFTTRLPRRSATTRMVKANAGPKTPCWPLR